VGLFVQEKADLISSSIRPTAGPTLSHKKRSFDMSKKTLLVKQKSKTRRRVALPSIPLRPEHDEHIRILGRWLNTQSIKRPKVSDALLFFCKLLGQEPASLEQLVHKFHQDWTLQNYIPLASKLPNDEIDLFPCDESEDALSAVLEDFSEEYREDIRRLLSDAMHGEPSAVEELSLAIINDIVGKQATETSDWKIVGLSKHKLPKKTVNFVMGMMLKGIVARKEPMQLPPSFVVLLLDRLCGSKPMLRQRSLSIRKRDKVALTAATNFKNDDEISVRKLADLCKIKRSTAHRWLQNEEFRSSIRKYRQALVNKETENSAA
jgi:hypothetical protein